MSPLICMVDACRGSSLGWAPFCREHWLMLTPTQRMQLRIARERHGMRSSQYVAELVSLIDQLGESELPPVA